MFENGRQHNCQNDNNSHRLYNILDAMLLLFNIQSQIDVVVPATHTPRTVSERASYL